MSFRIIQEVCDNCGRLALVTFIVSQHTTFCEDCLREAADALRAHREHDAQRPVEPNPPDPRFVSTSDEASTIGSVSTGTMTS